MCRIVRRRIACRTIRHRIASRHLPVRSGDLTSRRAHGRASGTPVVRHIPAQQPPGADAATGGLRTYILLYGCGVLPCLSRRRGSGGSLGRSHPDTLCRTVRAAGETAHHRIEPDIFGHIRAYPGLVTQRRAKKGRRVRYRSVPGTASGRAVACRIVPRRIASRMARRKEMVVACGRIRHRIVCDQARRGGNSPSPDRVREGSSRALSPGAGSRPVWLSPDRVSSRPVSAISVSLPCSRSGEPNARRPPYPGPTAACSRRRHRRFANMYSFVWLWRFTVSQSAARLRNVDLIKPKSVVSSQL